MSEKNQELTLSDNQLFVLMLGEDGQGGAIGSLRTELKEHGGKVENLDDTIKGFENRFAEYNGLHAEHDGLSATVAEHLEYCRKVQQAKETAKVVAEQTAEAYLQGVKEAEVKGAEETKATIKYTAFIITGVLGAIATLIGIVTYFLGLWPG